MTLSAGILQGLVAQWLPTQRWFAGKGRTVAQIAVRPLEILAPGPPEVSLWLATVTYDDPTATTETYQLPLVVRPEVVPTLEHVLIGSVPIDGVPHWVY